MGNLRMRCGDGLNRPGRPINEVTVVDVIAKEKSRERKEREMCVDRVGAIWPSADSCSGSAAGSIIQFTTLRWVVRPICSGLTIPAVSGLLVG